MKTIDKIITKVSAKYGAPMSRGNVTPAKFNIVKIADTKYLCVNQDNTGAKQIFDCAVPMSDGAYDKGGAYWGLGKQLRVQYTKDLTFIRFYRLGDS